MIVSAEQITISEDIILVLENLKYFPMGELGSIDTVVSTVKNTVLQRSSAWNHSFQM